MPSTKGALERARQRHREQAPEKYRRFLEQLRRQLPEREIALVGRHAVLSHLYSLGVRRRNLRPITWQMVLRWSREEEFPLLSGSWNKRYSTWPPITTSFSITAWLLSRGQNGFNPRLFVMISQDPESPK